MKTTLKRDNEKDSSSKKRNHLADNQSEKFIWSDEMTEYSLEFLKSYNITCDYSGTDFDADKTQQYPHVRKEMARKYKVERSHLWIFFYQQTASFTFQ